MGESVEGGNLDPVGLAARPDVVGTGQDVKVAGSVHTVGGGQDPVLGDEGAAAEPGVVDEEGHDPGVLVGLGLSSADNLLGGWGSLNTALGHQVVLGRLGGDLGPQLLGFPEQFKSSRRLYLCNLNLI